jgi:hypothetical protein
MPLFEELSAEERDRHLEALWDAYLDPKAAWPRSPIGASREVNDYREERLGTGHDLRRHA